MFWRFIFAVALPLVLLAGCKHSAEYAYYNENTGKAYRLDTGDQVRVIVFEQTELSRTYLVGSSGTISVPLAGVIRARGRTTTQLQRSIAARLEDRYVKDPKVSVEVAIYRPIFILGEVKNAGKYPFVNGMTIEKAVAVAGGYTERGYKKEMRVTRQGRGTKEVFYVPPDYTIRPGDTIFIKERWF